jgi:hypothetical protein
MNNNPTAVAKTAPFGPIFIFALSFCWTFCCELPAAHTPRRRIPQSQRPLSELVLETPTKVTASQAHSGLAKCGNYSPRREK